MAVLADTERNKSRYRKVRLKIGDEVVVNSGSEKGKRGKILYIDRRKDRVYVQGLNKVKRYQRPTQENPQGGVIEVETPMHISNVSFYDAKAKKGVRLGSKIEGSDKKRVTRPEGKEV